MELGFFQQNKEKKSITFYMPYKWEGDLYGGREELSCQRKLTEVWELLVSNTKALPKPWYSSFSGGKDHSERGVWVADRNSPTILLVIVC